MFADMLVCEGQGICVQIMPENLFFIQYPCELEGAAFIISLEHTT